MRVHHQGHNYMKRKVQSESESIWYILEKRKEKEQRTKGWRCRGDGIAEKWQNV